MAGNRNQSLEVPGSIPLFLTTGKPFGLVARLIASDSERQKQQILTDAMTACADSVVLGILTSDKAAKRVGTLISVDDSDDHERICLALEETDRKEPKAVEKIVSSLSASKLLQLDPTTGPSAELLIDYSTAGQLATLARYYTGKIFGAKAREDRVVKRNEFDLEFPDEDSMRLKSSRVNDATRELGRLLDLVVDRDNADNDGFLELFASALLRDEPVSSKGKSAKPVELSFMIDQIVDMASKRSSATRVIESLPNDNPMGWKAKMTLIKQGQ